MADEKKYTLESYLSQYPQGSLRSSNKFNNFNDEIDSNFMVDRGNRTSRLKEIIFPEHSIQILPDLHHTTNIVSSMVRLEKPALRFRFITTNMIDYLEDTSTAVMVADNLADLLRAKDVKESEKACQFIHNLCKKQASRLGLASSPKIVDGLKRTILTSKNPNIVSESVSSVQHISKGEQGATTIVAVDFIPVLLDLLNTSNDMKTVQSVVSTLDNLMHFVEKSKDIIRKSRGVESLVEHMEKNDVKFLTVVVNCLHKLTYNNNDAKKAMLVNQGSEKVVQILRQYTYEKLLFATSKLLKVLSVCNANKPVLVDLGAMEALSVLLRSGSPRLVLSCLWSVRNLSDHSSQINDMQKLIKRLIELLASDDDHTAICAIGCLCNLTSGNVENKLAFIEYGGVQGTCELICERVRQEEVVEPGAAALRHVTHNNHLAQQAADIIIQSPILSNLSVLIRGQPDKMLPLIKAIVGLVRNLSMISLQCRRSLIDLGITDSLCEIFYRTHTGINELSQQRNSIVSISSELSFVEGVRLDDLLELSLCALQALGKDNLAKKIISYQNRLLQIVSQMVTSTPLQRASLGLLAEMVEYADCARVIEAEGFNTRLSELIHSPNKAISTYAAIVMYVINLNKPEEYRNRLNSEIFESLQEKLAGLEQENDRDSFSQNSENYGSQLQLHQPSKSPHNTGLRLEANSNFYDNRAFEQDAGETSLHVKPKPKSRQRKPQPFRDVEL